MNATLAARERVSSDSGWYALISEFLAGLFMAPPSAEAVASYRDGVGTMFFDALADESGCTAGAQQMRSVMMADDSSASIARKLAIAFTHLFDGVDGLRTVSPYESAYVGGSGRLFQASVQNMDQLMRLSDVSIADNLTEPSDHLSIELALLAQLIRKADTDGAAHRAQIALLDEHLLTWVPNFADRCHDVDRTGFYAGAAAVVKGFLCTWRVVLQRDRAHGSDETPHRDLLINDSINQGLV